MIDKIKELFTGKDGDNSDSSEAMTFPEFWEKEPKLAQSYLIQLIAAGFALIACIIFSILTRIKKLQFPAYLIFYAMIILISTLTLRSRI